LWCSFEKNLNASAAAEASPGVEANQLWLAMLKDLTRAIDHFIFDTAGAKGASKGAIVADQHSRPGPTIT
jgi:hypothetical protein